MKIASPSSPTSAQALTNAGTSRPQSGATEMAGAPPNAAPSGGDATVNLSGLSGQLRALAASGDADIDTTLVQSIKDALKDGTLSIDASKIADGVLNTARELLQPPQAN